MRWIDMHCDTLSEIWKGHADSFRKNDLCVDLERLIRAEAEAQFFACFVNASDYLVKSFVPLEGENGSAALGKKKESGFDSGVWDRAYSAVLEMTELAQSEEDETFQIVRDLRAFGDAGLQGRAVFPGEDREGVAGILTLEEGGVLNNRSERLSRLFENGIRLITLTWNYENCIGSPNSRDPNVMKQGLKPFGIEVVERMNELGMIIDVSHLSDGGFWDCIRYSRRPVVASHSNARSLCPHPRNLSDEMLRALGENGGVAGVNFYSTFLKSSSGRGKTLRAEMDDLIRHIRWMIDQAGEDAVALGTDFDGFEKEALPEKISGVQDLERLWDAMRDSGITPRQIDKIASGNVKRVMREVGREKETFLFRR